MKTYRKKLKPLSPQDLLKETPEQRLQRVRQEGARYRTRIVEDKTKYNRKKLKSKNTY